MKQLLQNIRNGKTSITEVPIPTPGRGMALVRVAASLVSAGTERMVVEFAEKSLLGKARSRPDLLRQVFDKARREGVAPTLQATFNRLDQPMPLGYSSAGTIVGLGEEMEGFHIGQRVACAGEATPSMPNITLFRGPCSRLCRTRSISKRRPSPRLEPSPCMASA